jgi:hypothetical protein
MEVQYEKSKKVVRFGTDIEEDGTFNHQDATESTIKDENYVPPPGETFVKREELQSTIDHTTHIDTKTEENCYIKDEKLCHGKTFQIKPSEILKKRDQKALRKTCDNIEQII